MKNVPVPTRRAFLRVLAGLAAVVAVTGKPKDAARAAGPGTCVIVSRSRVMQSIAAKALGGLDLGLEFVKVPGGPEALEACRETMPVVVFLDWDQVPHDEAVDFMRTLRGLPGGSAPVIVCTSFDTDARTRETILKAGANGFTPKPYDSWTLEEEFAKHGLG